ncbi:Mut7-C RNAse domain-containing protein [Candidatus Omnitrophota bacterium]
MDRIQKKAHFRFYEELNDFLPAGKKKIRFPYEFQGKPSIKDAIEALGVPHTEVDLVLANGESVSFSYHLHNNDTISVYPVFESLDITPVIHLREKPLRDLKFILDVHLGKLARYLRMLGFDTLYENSHDDFTIVRLSSEQKRIILTRDTGLMKMKEVTHGYRIRSENPEDQVVEVLQRFDARSSVKPLCRCLVCNGLIIKIAKEDIIHLLEEKTKRYYDEFYQCPSCQKVYWKGSHYLRMKQFIKRIRGQG